MVKESISRRDAVVVLPPSFVRYGSELNFSPLLAFPPSSRIHPTELLAVAFGACSVCTLTHLPSRAKPQAASATGARLAGAGRVESTQLALMRARAAFQVRAGRRCVFGRAEHAP